MTAAPVVLFDLDGTLVQGDCVTRFLIKELRGRWWRGLLSVLVLPPFLPLFLWWRSAWIPASVAGWLASVGCSDDELRRRRDVFVDHCAQRSEQLLIASSTARLREHQQRGQRVVIITGAEASLAEALCAALGLLEGDTRVLGSSTRPWLGGRIAARHCVGSRKLQVLKEQGINPPFAVAYSDSLRDLPMLGLAQQAVVVRASPRHRRRLLQLLPQAQCLE